MSKEKLQYLYVALLGTMLFVPLLGLTPLFDWDEINFAESAREMMISGDYFRVQVNFQPFWEKPPFFLWMEVLSMKAFGVNEFAARFPNAVCGIITLLFIFHVGKKHFSQKLGWLWVLCYIGAFTPHIYFKSAIIDPTFNLFIFIGIYNIFIASQMGAGSRRLGRYALAGMFLGLAVLTKGPAAVAITLLCVAIYFAVKKFRWFFNIKDLLVYMLCALAVAFLWFGWETVNNGFFFLREFITYQVDLFKNPVASHGQPFYYHPVVLLFGCFPVSVIAFLMFRKSSEDSDEQRNFKLWMQILFWVVLILFSVVKTKIVHYSSMCYLPLTFLAAYIIYRVSENKLAWPKALNYVILTIGILLGSALTLIPLAGSFSSIKEKVISMINDPFAVLNFSRDVHWYGFEFIVGTVFIIVLVIAVILLFINKKLNGFILLLANTCLALQLFIYTSVPKIERYSQGAAIDYWKSFENKDVYVQPLGYDTYAHYFYAKVKPWENRAPGFKQFINENIERYRKSVSETEIFNRMLRDWLLDGEIDRPAYFCANINQADNYAKDRPELQKIGQQGGFVFFVRYPPR